MNNTALRAGWLSTSGACLATTEAERRPQSANNTHMVFANEKHEKFYYEKLEQARYQDCYRKAFISFSAYRRIQGTISARFSI